MTLLTTIASNFSAILTKALDLSVPEDSLVINHTLKMSSGTGANQSDLCWHDRRTLAASATEDLDLAGGVSDAFGAAITFKTIKMIMIRADSGNTNDVVAGGAGSNPLIGPWGAAGTAATRPGGETRCVAPGTGWTVTTGTGDLLKIANSAAGTAVTYDIVIIGTSA